MPFPSPGDLPNPGIEPGSPALQADALPSEPLGKPEQWKHPWRREHRPRWGLACRPVVCRVQGTSQGHILSLRPGGASGAVHTGGPTAGSGRPSPASRARWAARQSWANTSPCCSPRLPGPWPKHLPAAWCRPESGSAAPSHSEPFAQSRGHGSRGRRHPCRPAGSMGQRRPLCGQLTL